MNQRADGCDEDLPGRPAVEGSATAGGPTDEHSPQALGRDSDSRPTPTEAALLAEYQVASAAVFQYDNFKWNAGSFVIAGVFIFWGAVFAKDSPRELFAPGTVLVALVMSGWLLYASHYRQLYLLKLDRIQEIEHLLGMRSNLRFVNTGAGVLYRSFGIRGHNIDRAIFAVVSLGGPALALAREGPEYWQLMPVLIVICVIGWVLWNEERLHRRLDKVGRSPARNTR